MFILLPSYFKEGQMRPKIKYVNPTFLRTCLKCGRDMYSQEEVDAHDCGQEYTGMRGFKTPHDADNKVEKAGHKLPTANEQLLVLRKQAKELGIDNVQQMDREALESGVAAKTENPDVDIARDGSVVTADYLHENLTVKELHAMLDDNGVSTAGGAVKNKAVAAKEVFERGAYKGKV